MQLNEEQMKAAEFRNGICSVIAVPGSGKTLTMTHRIALLINRYSINPENILGLTFTRNAASAMRDKLQRVLKDKSSRVTLSTIHSFCHWLLRNEGKSFGILMGKEQIIFLKKIIKELRVKEISAGMALREISLAKNHLIDTEEFFLLHEGDQQMSKMAQIYERYEKDKAKAMLYDFDDLLVHTIDLLSSDEGIRERYRLSYRHILVDEFQDTNPAQMEILRLLVSDEGDFSFWVCGDDWQAIYAFTGATVGNILRFMEIFNDAEQHILSVNYRSTPQILEACMNLIDHNERKIEKVLRTHNESGPEITILECEHEEDEALQIVNEIKDLTERQGYSRKDIAVLYRANFQSMVIEEIFSREKIPYGIENGLNFFDRTEVRVLLDYLRFINYPYSEEGSEALLSIINIPNRYFGKTFIKELQEEASKKNIYLYEALKGFQTSVYYLRKGIREFTGLMDFLIEDDTKEPSGLIQTLRSTLDYDRIVTMEDVPSVDDIKVQNLNQLQMAAGKFSDIESFLLHAETFRNERDASDDNEDTSDRVALMTIHKAKGLEFPIVFLVGLIDIIIPTKKGDLEEERRICFVGMSRAMRHLYLSYSKSYMGQKVNKSQFIEEIMKPKNTKKGGKSNESKN